MERKLAAILAADVVGYSKLMAAWAAGELCASWICGGGLLDYSDDLSLGRYRNATLMTHLEQLDIDGAL